MKEVQEKQLEYCKTGESGQKIYNLITQVDIAETLSNRYQRGSIYTPIAEEAILDFLGQDLEACEITGLPADVSVQPLSARIRYIIKEEKLEHKVKVKTRQGRLFLVNPARDAEYTTHSYKARIAMRKYRAAGKGDILRMEAAI